MKRLIVFVLILYLVLNSSLFLNGNISPVEASPDIFQGNLILQGNNVTVIEGEFIINGSIIIEENATLILRNGIVNFTQTTDRQLNLTLENPINGNPRLVALNMTLTSKYEFPIYLSQNATSDFSNSTLLKTSTFQLDGSAMTFQDSIIEYTLWLHGLTRLDINNSTIGSMMIYDSPTLRIFSSTVNSLSIGPYSVWSWISALKPGLFNQWNFISNCSVSVLPSGTAPDLTLINTRVNSWRFGIYGASTVTVTDSIIRDFSAFGSTSLLVSDSSITSYVYARDNAVVLLINSSYSHIDGIDDSAYIEVAWHLDVHVVDSNGTDVRSANVTANYPNATLAESEITGPNGRAKLALIEKTINNTGEYSTGNYTIKSTYESYVNSATVNMTENKQIALSMPFIVPELQSMPLMPLCVFATLMVVVVCRRKRGA